MEIKKVFAERLQKCRKEINFTQKKLCEELLIDLNVYRHYESNSEVTMPPYDKLVLLSKKLDVSIDYLLGLTNTSQKH